MSEINQIIHEKLMGIRKCPGCGHKPHLSGGCLNIASGKDCDCKTESSCLEYDTNLNDAFTAQAKAIERFGDEYYFALLNITSGDAKPFTPGIKEIGAMVSADATDRCAAMRRLLEAEK